MSKKNGKYKKQNQCRNDNILHRVKGYGLERVYISLFVLESLENANKQSSALDYCFFFVEGEENDVVFFWASACAVRCARVSSK